jgi:hypothetical protein
VELRRENAERARVLVGELPRPRPDLLRRLNALETDLMRRAGAMKSLQRLRFESDLTVQARSRRWIALGLGAALGLGVCTLFVLRVLGLHEAGFLDAVILMTAFTMASFGARLGVGRIHANAINRSIMTTSALAAGGVTVELAIAWMMGVDFSAALALVMVSCSVASLVAGVTLDIRLMWTAGCFFLGAVGVALAPELRGLVVGVASFAAFGAGAWAWRHLEVEEARRAEASQPTGV